MKNIKYVEKKDFNKEGKCRVHDMDVLLDIGCGIMPQKENYHPKVHICAEPFTQYVEVLQKKIAKDYMQDRKWIILQNDFNQVLDTIPDNSVDTIMMIDVIEHIEKEEVKKYLTKMLKKVRQQCVILTPLGFMPQEHETSVDAWGLNGND
jgi:cyclopropane fatty-acyl-phospholipid synthase-like methyltransferase